MTKANFKKEEMIWVTIPEQQKSVVARTLLSGFEEFVKGLHFELQEGNRENRKYCVHPETLKNLLKWYISSHKATPPFSKKATK